MPLAAVPLSRLPGRAHFSTAVTTVRPPVYIQGTVPQPDEKPLPVSSSTPPKFAPEQIRLFREVLELMNRCGVPYVVSGAFALQQHTGICRDTKDLDLFLPPENVSHALDCLRTDGFECDIPDPVWLAKARREEFFVDLITGMSNGVIGVDRSWIDRGSPASIFDVPTRVLAAEELIASKLFVTRRERFDGADIAHVIYGTRGGLDWNRILQLCGEHWEVLLWSLVLYGYVYPRHTGYVPGHIWNGLLDRFRERVAHPDPAAKFRGSLIDDKMFAIDVEEWGLENLEAQYRVRRHVIDAGPSCDAPAADLRNVS
jgi:hypothetical protein